MTPLPDSTVVPVVPDIVPPAQVNAPPMSTSPEPPSTPLSKRNAESKVVA